MEIIEVVFEELIIFNNLLDDSINILFCFGIFEVSSIIIFFINLFSRSTVNNCTNILFGVEFWFFYNWSWFWFYNFWCWFSYNWCWFFYNWCWFWFYNFWCWFWFYDVFKFWMGMRNLWISMMMEDCVIVMSMDIIWSISW